MKSVVAKVGYKGVQYSEKATVHQKIDALRAAIRANRLEVSAIRRLEAMEREISANAISPKTMRPSSSARMARLYREQNAVMIRELSQLKKKAAVIGFVARLVRPAKTRQSMFVG